MPVPTGQAHISSEEENDTPPPASTAAASLTRASSAPLNASAPSMVVAPGPSSTHSHTISHRDPKDPLGLNTLPPAGSFIPGLGFVPQMHQPPKVSARLQEPAATARPMVSAASNIEPEKVKMPARHDSESSGTFLL